MTQEKATTIAQLTDAVEYIRNNDAHTLAVGAIAALTDAVNERNALLSEVAQLKASRRVHELDNHHNALACGYCNGPLRERLVETETEIAQLREACKKALTCASLNSDVRALIVAALAEKER
jgi:hypothetical protein